MIGNDKTIDAAPKPKGPKPARPGGPRGEAQQIGVVTPEQHQMIRARQDSRSRVMGLILLALCLLFFAITLVKVGLS